EADADEFVETKFLGTGNLDCPVDRRSCGDSGHLFRNIVGCHRLDENRGKLHLIALRRGGGNSLDELEELGRLNDRIGQCRLLDEVFLSNLGPEVWALGKAMGTDDGEGDQMLDASLHTVREKVPCGGSKELHHRFFFPRRGIRYIHDDLSSLQHLT